MIQPTGSVGYGVTRIWRRTYSLGRSSSRRSRSSVFANASSADSICRIQLGSHTRALLDDADLEAREVIEDAVEDHRRQRLHRRERDRHVVDRAEVLGAAVEVGHHRQAVLEVVRDRAAGRRRRRGRRSARRPPAPPPRPGRGRCGSASVRAGRPTGSSAPCSPWRSPPRPARGRASKSASGT